MFRQSQGSFDILVNTWDRGRNTYSISSILTNATYVLYSNIPLYDIYQVDTSLNQVSFILPPATTKRIHTFVDVGGNLGGNPFVIQTTVPDTIVNETSVTLSTNYTSITVASNTTNRWLII